MCFSFFLKTCNLLIVFFSLTGFLIEAEAPDISHRAGCFDGGGSTASSSSSRRFLPRRPEAVRVGVAGDTGILFGVRKDLMEGVSLLPDLTLDSGLRSLREDVKN